jgi:CO dehydrogenase maturation factor
MKLGIVGKGGVGKTTLSALIAQEYAARGLRVLAIDTDSNPNLAFSLGLDALQFSLLQRPMPPGFVGKGGDGSMTTAELINTYGAVTPSQVTLLHAMRITQAGAG